MEESTENGSMTPPYVAFKTLKNFLRMIASAMPNRIDKHVMPTFSGANQAMVIQALRYLQLIDAAGKPTEKLYKLVDALDDPEKYSVALFDVLDDAYPFTLDHTVATDGEVNEAFSALASGDTVRKCKSFYLAALKDGGATLSPYIKEPGKRGPSGGTKRAKMRRTKQPAGQGRTDNAPPPPPPGQHAPNVHPALAGMLKELPKAGSPWPKAKKDLFVAAMRGILDVVYPDE